MDFLTTPQSIYETLTAKAENVWVTVYPDPGGKNNCLFAGEGDPSDQWHLVESIIRNAAGRYNRFKIRIALGTKNAMPQEIPVQVAGTGATSQVAGIGNLPGMYSGAADIGAIKREMKEEFAEQMKREKELWEMQNQIAGLSAELQQKKRKSGDVMDKIEGFAQTTGLDLSNPQAIQAVSGLVMGALDKVLGVFARHPQPTPAMAGAPRPGRTNIHRSEASAPVPHGTEDEPDLEPGEEPLDELNEQELMALDAHDILAEAGATAPGELLKRVAEFYAKDPAKAEGFLKFL